MNKLLKLLVAMIAATSISFAGTQLTDSISVGGFIDMSYVDADQAVESTSGIDQVEIDFSFDNGGPASAQLDIEYENGNGGVAVEEAYIDYALSNGAVITVGRFETMLLQDGTEPTDMYQYSNSYAFYGDNGNAFLADLADQGIKFTTGGFSASLVDNGDSKIGDGAANGDYSIEVGYNAALSDSLSGFIGARLVEDDAANTDGDIINAHITYAEGPWVIGGEIVSADATTNLDLLGTQALNADIDALKIFANYSYSENNSITVRYSEAEADFNIVGTADLELEKFTIAHNSALSHDLGLVIEYSMEESNNAALLDTDTLAVELLYAF